MIGPVRALHNASYMPWEKISDHNPAFGGQMKEIAFFLMTQINYHRDLLVSDNPASWRMEGQPQ